MIQSTSSLVVHKLEELRIMLIYQVNKKKKSYAQANIKRRPKETNINNKLKNFKA